MLSYRQELKCYAILCGLGSACLKMHACWSLSDRMRSTTIANVAALRKVHAWMMHCWLEGLTCNPGIMRCSMYLFPQACIHACLHHQQLWLQCHVRSCWLFGMHYSARMLNAKAKPCTKPNVISWSDTSTLAYVCVSISPQYSILQQLIPCYNEALDK